MVEVRTSRVTPRYERGDRGGLRRYLGPQGLSKKDIIRCLKRYVAREVYPYLRG